MTESNQPPIQNNFAYSDLPNGNFYAADSTFITGSPENPFEDVYSQPAYLAPAAIDDPSNYYIQQDVIAEYLEENAYASIDETIIHDEATEVTPPLMHRFHSNSEPYRCTVTLYSPKAAQKSYCKNKIEKRYFTPNPRIDFSGQGWHKLFWQLKALGMVENDTDLAQSFTASCYSIGEEDDQKVVKSSKISAKDDALLSHLIKISISEATQAILGIKLHFSNYHFADLCSENITIISKASKCVNKCDETSSQYHRNIKSGDTIALYCRPSQSTTVLLGSDANTTDQNHWGVFEIFTVSNDSHSPGLISRGRFEQITYDSTVLLVDTLTKHKLGPMKIRSAQTFKGTGDSDGIPVSELQVCFFEGSNSLYMAAQNSTIQFKALPGKTAREFQWFIVTAQAIKHQFYPLLKLRPTFSLKQLPIFWKCRFAGIDATGKKVCHLALKTFAEFSSIWVGSCRCDLKSVNSSGVRFYPPTYLQYNDHCIQHGIPPLGTASFPILAVTQDGVAFDTHFVYAFNQAGKEYGEIFSVH